VNILYATNSRPSVCSIWNNKITVRVLFFTLSIHFFFPETPFRNCKYNSHRPVNMRLYNLSPIMWKAKADQPPAHNILHNRCIILLVDTTFIDNGIYVIYYKIHYIFVYYNRERFKVFCTFVIYFVHIQNNIHGDSFSLLQGLCN